MIKDIQVKGLPYFPELSGQKTARVITKHFTNAAMYLPQNQFALLTWLIYQSKADNTVIYSTQLLTRYSAASLAAVKMYFGPDRTTPSIKVARLIFCQLVENGYLLPNYNKKVFTINPMLSYRAEYMRPVHYQQICEEYQNLFKDQHLAEATNIWLKVFTAKYSKIVEGYMSKKKIAK